MEASVPRGCLLHPPLAGSACDSKRRSGTRVASLNPGRSPGLRLQDWRARRRPCIKAAVAGGCEGVMRQSSIPVVDLEDLRAGGERRARFVETMGRALVDIGFFAVKNHEIPQAEIAAAYEEARAFFSLPLEQKRRYEDPTKKAQRGFTSFGKEH